MDEHFFKFRYEFENPFIISYLHSLSSSCLVCEYSCKFNEASILGPIWSYLYFKCMTLKHSRQIRIKHLQILVQVLLGPTCPNLRFWIRYWKMPMSGLHSIPSKFLECKLSSKSGEILNLVSVCLKTDFRYKILKHQCQTRTQRL